MASVAPSLPASGDSTAFPPARRQAERLSVLLPAKLTLLDGEFDCAIEDVSQTGARIITDATLRTGQQGILLCHPLDALFSVVWTDGKAAGLEFDEEATLGTIRTLRWDNDLHRQRYDAELRKMVQDWDTGSPG